MLRPALVLAATLAATAFPTNTTKGWLSPDAKDARLNAYRNATGVKLAIAAAAANGTVSHKAAIAAEIAALKDSVMLKLNKLNATCSPGFYTVSARRRGLLANNGCATCGTGYYCSGSPVPQAPAPRYQCPAGSTTLSPAATSAADCVCAPGYYGLPTAC